MIVREYLDIEELRTISECFEVSDCTGDDCILLSYNDTPSMVFLQPLFFHSTLHLQVSPMVSSSSSSNSRNSLCSQKGKTSIHVANHYIRRSFL